MRDEEYDVLLVLVRAGLWEKDVKLLSDDKIDYQKVLRLAQEQSITGLVAAGIEHVSNLHISKETSLLFASEVMRLEQRNQSMNLFIADLIERLRKADVFTLLVKGQGIAQCYERPLWRACGDVDLLLSDQNYKKAVSCLSTIASSIDAEITYKKHKAMTISAWEVDLHGTLRSGLWKKLDGVIDDVQNEVFCAGAVRSWINGNTHVFLPKPDEDVIFIFAHILQHFYRGGIGLRQVCDWCRLLWTYRDNIDKRKLESRLRKMRVMNEWKSFAALAVNTLGMPGNAMPFYSPSSCWERKAQRIIDLILEMGNFGHSRIGYQSIKPIVLRRAITFWLFTKDNIRQLSISPVNPFRVWYNLIKIKLFRRYV